MADALPVLAGWTKSLASLRTRLNPFSDEEQGRLINGGYALCDAALRKYVLTAPAPKPPKWPYPMYALDQPVPAALEPAGDAAYPATI